jgi:N-carbamoylputrescine amidase
MNQKQKYEQGYILRVAAAQMETRNGEIKANLAHATALVEEAARREAQLVVFPELMPTGYALTKENWEAAEPREGPTVRWLKESSKQWGMWIGTSFLEADGEDFFNTFVLTAPTGEEAGRVRKQFPAVWEAYFFKGDPGSHVIETALGKIGVGICFDSHLAAIARLLQEQSVDLVLMPHFYPMAEKPSRLVSERDIARSKRILQEMAPLYARLLGVPAVLVNKSGPWVSAVPSSLLPKPGPSCFPGLSTIADSDGAIKAQLGGEEGAIVAEVMLDPSRKIHTKPPQYSRWIYPGPAGREILGVVEWMGRRWYARNAQRKSKARAISSQQSGIKGDHGEESHHLPRLVP